MNRRPFLIVAVSLIENAAFVCAAKTALLPTSTLTVEVLSVDQQSVTRVPATSPRRPTHSAASIAGEQPRRHPRQRDGPGTPTSRC